jgi:hypothetical protein
MALPFKTKAHSAPPSVGAFTQSQRQDITLIPGLRDRVYPFWKGNSWVRILPGIEGSKSDTFMIKVPILRRGNYTAVDPHFFGQRSLFREAHLGIRDSQDPEVSSRRYNKEKNPNGVRCWPTDHFVCWVLGIVPASSRYEVLIANANDGSVGGPAQLGHKILVQATKTNDDPSLPPEQRGKALFDDVSAIETGNHLNIQKIGGGGNSVYEAQFSPTPTNVTKEVQAMPKAENDLLKPLEQILYCPTLEEQKEILISILGTNLFYTLFPEFAPGISTEQPAAAAAPVNPTPEPVSTPVSAPVAVATPEPAQPAPVAAEVAAPVSAPVEPVAAAAVETPAAAAPVATAPVEAAAAPAAAAAAPDMMAIIGALRDFTAEQTPENTATLKGHLDANPQIREFALGSLTADQRALLGYA